MKMKRFHILLLASAMLCTPAHADWRTDALNDLKASKKERPPTPAKPVLPVPEPKATELSQSASPITKEECQKLYDSVPGKMIPALNNAVTSLEKMNSSWDNAIPKFRGQLKTSAEIAKQAGEESVLALRRFRSTLENFGNELQMCEQSTGPAAPVQNLPTVSRPSSEPRTAKPTDTAAAPLLDIRPAPNGPEKLIAESILGRDFDRPDCPTVVRALRLGDGSIRAVCSNGEDFRVFNLNGKTIAMRCSAARQLGAGC